MTDSFYRLCLEVRLRWNSNPAVRWMVYILVILFFISYIQQWQAIERLESLGVYEVHECYLH